MKKGFWFTPRVEAMIQYVCFAVLVVLTPFIVVTKYLQTAVHKISHFSFYIKDFEVPYVLLVFITVVVSVIIWQWKNLTRKRLIAFAVILTMISISHQVMDVYLDMSFYDLQQNWHYIAYCAYAFFFFRAFNARAMPVNKMVLIAFASAIAMSLFDETFQYNMSDRVFDISDIFKDGWGSIIGLIIVLFVAKDYYNQKFSFKELTQKRIFDYFKNPLSSFFVVWLYCFANIFTSPALSGFEYWAYSLASGISLFLLLFLFIHSMQFKIGKIISLSLLSAIVLSLITSFAINHGKLMQHDSRHLSVYNGIPIAFFDFVIKPNGTFIIADKKSRFSNRDLNWFLKQDADIVIIGNGTGKGYGKRSAMKNDTYFVFNEYTGRGTQVIILSNPAACERYNDLKSKDKKVLLVVHHPT